MVDIVIIGGGPAGYISALKAAKLNKEVVLIEKDQLGGTCLNRGCIPTKSLLHASHKFYELSKSEFFGISINEATVDGDSFYVTLISSGTVTVKCNAPSNLSRIQTINSITIYAVARMNNHTETIRYGLSSPSSSYSSSSISGTSYATFSHVVTVNNTPANFNLNNLNIFLSPGYVVFQSQFCILHKMVFFYCFGLPLLCHNTNIFL